MKDQSRTLISVDAIRVGNRFRKEIANIDKLARSMDRLGLLQPIGVSPDHELIFGLRRLCAAKKLGWDTIPVRIVDLDEPLLAERDENEEREPFTVSERVAIGKAIEAKIGKRQGQRTDKELSKKVCEVPTGERTDRTAAKQAGFGNETTYRQATKVVDKGTPELVEAMDRGKVSISDAAAVAEAPPEQQREAIEAVNNGTTKTASRAIAEQDPGSVEGQIRREREAIRLARRSLKSFSENLADLYSSGHLRKLYGDVRDKLTALESSFRQLSNAVNNK